MPLSTHPQRYFDSASLVKSLNNVHYIVGNCTFYIGEDWPPFISAMIFQLSLQLHCNTLAERIAKYKKYLYESL